MASRTKRTQNDTGPPFRSTIKDATKAVVNLTGATAVRFHMNDKDSGESVLDAAGALLDAANGRVEYSIQAGDLDLAVGEYEQEWEITLASGQVQTFPTGPEKNIVEITRELA